MKILVTNDDGIFAEGLWTLARELQSLGQVVAVAPDRERSAAGTAVTLAHPLRARPAHAQVPGVETYAVEGTPADSAILALSRLAKPPVDLVVSGINQGANLGYDVLISGTVGAALQGYLRGIPSVAISVDALDGLYLDSAARLAALLANLFDAGVLPPNLFLNVNLPNRPLAEIRGVKVTRLASESHTDTVKEGHDGRREYYWIVRQRISQDTSEQTDVGAVKQGYISITSLYTDLTSQPAPTLPETLATELFNELRQS